MTCIIGCKRNGKVYLGGDSIGISGLDATPRADTKVFVRDGLAIGYTSSFRLGQLLRFSLVIPPIPQGMDLYQYMVTLFVDGVRDCGKKGGYASKHDEVEEGGTFIVGTRGRLFTIQDDYQVAESLRPYESVGCGSSYALGAMAATHLKDPAKAIRKALEVAAEFSAGVRPPFNVVSVGSSKH